MKEREVKLEAKDAGKQKDLDMETEKESGKVDTDGD